MQGNLFKREINPPEIIVQFIKYSIVGFTNFLLTLTIYYFMLRVFSIWYIVSSMISWSCGVLYAYSINFIWVFKPEEKIEFKKRLWKYTLVYGVSQLVNVILLSIMVEIFGLDPFWNAFFIIPLVVLINFTGIKYWALRKQK